MTEYLTTRELAQLLRIKQRKVYALASSGAVPCTRATGKLLFPRDAIQAWLRENNNHLATPDNQRPLVFLGSHDPLLEWAIRESGCGIATWVDGSTDGLHRFAKHEGIASGLHIRNTSDDNWNTEIVNSTCAGHSAVLVAWAIRSRGLVIPADRLNTIDNIADIATLRIACRQASAGAQDLLRKLATAAGLDEANLLFTEPYRSESDAALAVLDNKADVAFGLKAMASQYKLAFVPVIEERYDVLVDRRAWFEEPWQTLLAFCQSDRYLQRANELSGYDLTTHGQVRLNL